MRLDATRRGAEAGERSAARRLPHLIAALGISLHAFGPGEALAHPDSPASPPLVPSPLHLKHREPAAMVALFARERLPGGSGEAVPRAARAAAHCVGARAESLLPPGIDALLRATLPLSASDGGAAQWPRSGQGVPTKWVLGPVPGGLGSGVVLVGTAGVLPEVRDCIAVLDAPVEQTGPDRERVVVTLRRADAGRLRRAVLRLPGAGSAVLTGSHLALDGSPGWLHRALRQVIRAELGQPETYGTG